MTVLIDSWAWIEYWKGGKLATAAAKYIEGDEESIVSAVNISEVFFWVARYYDESTALEKLETVEKRCSVIALDREIAIRAAKLKIDSKLAFADSLILATARQLHSKLVTGDPDMKGLKDTIFIPGE